MDELFIDTNVFFYAFGAEHRYKEACGRIMQAIETGTMRACTSSEVLQEILYRNFHIGRGTEGIRIAKHLLKYFPRILSIRKAEIERGVRLLEKYNQLLVRDAIHVAAMVENNITKILSADRDFDRITEIERIDPLEIISSTH